VGDRHGEPSSGGGGGGGSLSSGGFDLPRRTSFGAARRWTLPAARREPVRYPPEELWSEIAYLAYHLHWEFDTLLDLEHGDRIRLIREVAGLNERAWEGVRNGG
jgi:hypothetical protein